MFNFSKKLALGLDLSDLSLKVIQLEKTREGLSLANFIKKDIPAGLIQGGEIKQEKKLVTLLKETLKKAKGGILENKQVVCNLPEEKVFIRVIQLPRMKKEELNQAVKWEAEAHIPLKIDEVYLDWQMIRPLENHLDHYDILVAATPRSLVDNYLSFLRKVGLEPVALEPESVAVVRNLIRPDDLRPTIIVDLGMNGTNFVIFAALAIRFSSHISISGQLFNQAIMTSLSVDENEANQLKIKVGLDKTKKGGKVYQALEPLVDNLVKEIEGYIVFHHKHASHVHGPDGVIAQVLLCGGDSLLLNLPSFLKQRLNLPVTLGNPLINIPDSQNFSLSQRRALTCATALGLALRTYNL